jgi:hypothetical protein
MCLRKSRQGLNTFRLFAPGENPEDRGRFGFGQNPEEGLMQDVGRQMLGFLRIKALL